MFVSIVVPTYNRKNLLKFCLRSLIRQSYPEEDYEILVIDDGSTDGTVKFLRKIGKKITNLSFFRGRGNGPGVARNIGIKKSEGKMIFFTDDDCTVPKDWIENYVAFYREHSEVGGVGGYLEAEDGIIESNLFAEYESYMSKLNYGLDKNGEYIGGFETPAGGTGNMSYKKEVLENVNGFDEDFPVAAGEDADLKLRVIMEGYNIAYLPLKVVHHREYSFSDFLSQNLSRGIGEAFFKKKWGNIESERSKFGLETRENFLHNFVSDLRFHMIILFLIEIFTKRFGIFKSKFGKY